VKRIAALLADIRSKGAALDEKQKPDRLPETGSEWRVRQEFVTLVRTRS
jgi:hypothetical protein